MCVVPVTHRSTWSDRLASALAGGGKVCDGRDMFDSDVVDVIRDDLAAVPTLHRKQWEFALIFLTLRRLGFLDTSRTGLSMGGGRELLLYSLARHVGRLVVTDLYDSATTWEGARTDDPDAFIKSGKPFDVDDDRLQALRMDMRVLEFPDESFDFCYSSCAVEHIGDHADFLAHLKEAHRILKRGGVYIMTTEFTFDHDTIEHPDNYYFSATYLSRLIAETAFTTSGPVDARLTPHLVNMPLPANRADLVHAGSDHLSSYFLRELPYLQLLRGKHPITSVLLILRKNGGPKQETVFTGLAESRAFLESGIERYRELLRGCRLSLNPFSFVPGGTPRVCAAPSPQGPRGGAAEADVTPFHTDYHWFGSGRRIFQVRLAAPADSRRQSAGLLFLVHRFPTRDPRALDCAHSETIETSVDGHTTYTCVLDTDDDYHYAILAKVVRGSCVFSSVEIDSWTV